MHISGAAHTYSDAIVQYLDTHTCTHTHTQTHTHTHTHTHAHTHTDTHSHTHTHTHTRARVHTRAHVHTHTHTHTHTLTHTQTEGYIRVDYSKLMFFFISCIHLRTCMCVTKHIFFCCGGGNFEYSSLTVKRLTRPLVDLLSVLTFGPTISLLQLAQPLSRPRSQNRRTNKWGCCCVFFFFCNVCASVQDALFLPITCQWHGTTRTWKIEGKDE